MQQTATGKTLLVPPSRVGRNVLGKMLSSKGLKVLELPRLQGGPPTDLPGLEAAVEKAVNAPLDWLVFSGELSVKYFWQCWQKKADNPVLPNGLKIAAVGYSTVSALKKLELSVQYAPSEHVAKKATVGFGELAGKSLLLVREESASRDLIVELQKRGALVREVAGYRVNVELLPIDVEQIQSRKPDVLALANPAAMRFLGRAAVALKIDLDQMLEGISIAAAGPATAREAMRFGFGAQLVSTGHLSDLTNEILEWLS